MAIPANRADPYRTRPTARDRPYILDDLDDVTIEMTMSLFGIARPYILDDLDDVTIEMTMSLFGIASKG